MPQPDAPQDRIRLAFDGYVLDVARRELRRGSQLVATEPQVFDLILHLVQNPDRLIDRDELQQAVWHGRIVSDSAITSRITAARRAIGDSGRAQRLIRTVPRRGLCFIGRVEELSAETAESATRAHFRGRAWRFAGIGLLAACVAVTVTWLKLSPSFDAETGARQRVLVSALPVTSPGAGVPNPTAITVGEPALFRDALPLLIARTNPAVAKSNRDATGDGPTAGPLVPAAAEPEQKVPLSDVTVTTSAPIQPVHPFAGNAGVDEAKWPVIPCATAHIDLGAGAKCQAGMPLSRSGLCDITRQVAMVTNARYQIEADVVIFDPTKVTAAGHQGKNCTVWSGYIHMPDDFKNMNQMTRQGSGWTNFVRSSPQSIVSFVDSGRNCVAVERLGPSWHGGYIWVMHASICPATAGSVQLRDIDAAFAALKLRTYDAQGNLRAQSQ